MASPIYNSDRGINIAIRLVSKELKRNLTDSQKKSVADYMRGLPETYTRGFEPEVVFKVIVETLAAYFKKNHVEEPDIQDVLRASIGTTGEDGTLKLDTLTGETDGKKSALSVSIARIMGENTASGVQKFINPDARLRRTQVVLDSKNRVVSETKMSLKWNVANTVTPAVGAVNIIGAVRDVVTIRVFPVRIPYVDSADNDLKRITMGIDEFATQSVIAPEDRRFHFTFYPTTEGDWINLCPFNYNDGYFRFSKPVRPESFSLSFGSPMEIINFDIDRSQSTIIGLGNPTIVQTLVVNNLSSGNTVYFSGMSTIQPGTDTALVTAFNTQTTGYPVTVIDPYTFSVPIDTSSLETVMTGTSGMITGSTTLNGVGTSYLTEVKIGDTIRLTDGVNFYYRVVASITSNILLDFTTPYTGPPFGGTIAYVVRYSDGTFLTYFNSKRIIVNMELTYIEPDAFDVE